MDRICLLVDLNLDGLKEKWPELTESVNFPLAISYATAEEVDQMLLTGTVVMMVVFCRASDKSNEVAKLLELFRQRVGPLAHFQAIVCSEPEPNFLADVFEFGIENFVSEEFWPRDIAAQAREVVRILDDENSSEKKIIHLSVSIAKGDQGGIAEAEKGLGDAHEYDYLAAYSKAQALQAIGNFEEAASVFRNAGTMNKHFRPADSKLGENLMVLGRVDEAIKIFEKLEKGNARSAERKATLASAYTEKGDHEKAAALMKEAQALNPSHPKIKETQAQILLATGKAGEAFKMMDQLEEVGPFLAAKLNEMGIKLSQSGKGKSALALYQKAHKVVKKELRYKVSMNAALACYRLNDFNMALKYLARTEKEYGRSLDKVDKIRKACRASLAKDKKAIAS